MGITSTSLPILADEASLTTASGKMAINTNGITTAMIATGQVTSNKIADGTIVDADVSASASIASTKLSGLGMSFLGRTQLGSAGASIDVTGLTTSAYRWLMIVVEATASSGSGDMYMQFNADSGTNYDFKRLINATASSATGQAYIRNGTSGTTKSMMRMMINNDASVSKVGTGQSYNAGTQDIVSFGGRWNNTANNITQVSLLNDTGGGTYATGSYVEVYGISN